MLGLGRARPASESQPARAIRGSSGSARHPSKQQRQRMPSTRRTRPLHRRAPPRSAGTNFCCSPPHCAVRTSRCRIAAHAIAAPRSIGGRQRQPLMLRLLQQLQLPLLHQLQLPHQKQTSSTRPSRWCTSYPTPLPTSHCVQPLSLPCSRSHSRSFPLSPSLPQSLPPAFPHYLRP